MRQDEGKRLRIADPGCVSDLPLQLGGRLPQIAVEEEIKPNVTWRVSPALEACLLAREKATLEDGRRRERVPCRAVLLTEKTADHSWGCTISH
jgi:hypothetical protein